MGHQNRDDYDRELGPLSLVDSRCIRQRDLIQFGIVVFDHFDGLKSELPDDPLGEDRSPPYQTAAQILLNAV